MNPTKLLLLSHIIAGFIGLLSGLAVLVLKKGDKCHKLMGQVFLYAMLFTALVGLILAYTTSSIFFFVVGIFTIYLVGTGSRYIYLKLQGADKASAKPLDWVLTILMLLSGLFMVYIGVKNFVAGNTGGIILAVFGCIGLSGVWQDLRYYRGIERSKIFWLRTHIARMVGGFIAATTAFLVNNIQHLPAIPGYIYWLLPTVILTPLIIKWQKQYLSKKG